MAYGLNIYGVDGALTLSGESITRLYVTGQVTVPPLTHVYVYYANAGNAVMIKRGATSVVVSSCTNGYASFYNNSWHTAFTVDYWVYLT
jgi:hypothetical protein